jgi:hypothetical protein
MTREQANKLIDRWAGDPMVADDEIATAMRLIRAHNAELVAALTAALPYVVHSIKNDPDAPWMRGLPVEPAEAVRRKIKAALAAAGHKQRGGG